MNGTVALLLFLLCACGAISANGGPPLPADYCHWQMENLAIRQPLCDLRGNAAKGRETVIDTAAGNCLACHRLPVPEEALHGTLGPPLLALASRKTEGQIRLHVVDQRVLNPESVMPGFYRDPRLANRVADEYWGKTFLNAQQIENVVAYLMTLK